MILQKQITLLAGLGFLTPGTALAQNANDLIVSGRVRLIAGSQKIDANSELVSVDNQSRIGVRAKHTIGDGLSVGANLGAGVGYTDGVTNPRAFFARAANVGISRSEFGEIKLGRMLASTAYLATAESTSHLGHDNGSSADALYDFSATGSLNNAFSYATPRIDNLQPEGQ